MADPYEYVKKFYIDSLVHDEEALRYNIKLFGTERIALGSDFPFPLGDLEHGKFIERMKDLTTEEKARMLSGTAKQWLGMTE